MNDEKVNNAVMGIMLAMKGYNLTPMEEIAALGRSMSTCARTIDTMYNLEKKPDHEIVESMLKDIENLCGEPR